MNEAEWLVCSELRLMKAYLEEGFKFSPRKMRLFGVACCRRIWHLLPDERSREAVEIAERYADDRTIEAAAARIADEMEREFDAPGSFHARSAAHHAVHIGSYPSGSHPAAVAVALAGGVRADHGEARQVQVAKKRAEESAQLHLLRDIFGNPFRPSSPLPPAVLAWNDGTIPRIAEGIYDERRMPEGTLDNSRLVILADALLDAGCEDETPIQHCRSEGPHVRGCWAIDLILGKE